jgi:hypothetical protein
MHFPCSPRHRPLIGCNRGAFTAGAEPSLHTACANQYECTEHTIAMCEPYRRTGNYSSNLKIHTVLLTGNGSITTCVAAGKYSHSPTWPLHALTATLGRHFFTRLN